MNETGVAAREAREAHEAREAREARERRRNALRWTALGLSLVIGVALLILLRRPEQQSLWRHESRAGVGLYVEKAVGAAGLAGLRGEIRGLGPALEAVGADGALLRGLTVFAGLGSFASLSPDDPLLARDFAGRGPELRMLRMLGLRSGLGERVSPSHVTDDGAFIFIDLSRPAAGAFAHGLGHALARRSIPAAVLPSLVPSPRYSKQDVAAFALLEECAALSLEGLAAGDGISRPEAGPLGDGAAGLDRLLAARFAPDGEFMRGDSLETLFSGDSRPPEYFAAAAGLVRGLIARRGEGAVLSWLARFLEGGYASLGELAAEFGLDVEGLAGIAAGAGG